MNMEEIIKEHRKLDHELFMALSTMERKNTIFEIRQKMFALQNECPHFSAEHNFAIINDCCPYCGKTLGGNTNGRSY